MVSVSVLIPKTCCAFFRFKSSLDFALIGAILSRADFMRDGTPPRRIFGLMNSGDERDVEIGEKIGDSTSPGY